MSHRYFQFAALVVLGALYGTPARAVENVGTLPTPTMTKVKAAASVTYDAAKKLYTYTYSVSSGAEGTGAISDVDIYMARKYQPSKGSDRFAAFADQLALPFGRVTKTFSDLKNQLKPLELPPGDFLVPYGISSVPPHWAGMMSRDGYASFDSLKDAADIPPGGQLGNLKLVSPGPPVIREMVVEPWWVPTFNGEPSQAEKEKAGKIQQSILVRLPTLAPAGVPVLSWSELEAEVAHAVKLGWISDATLAQKIQSQLDAANTAAVKHRDGTTAKKTLRSLLQTVASASATQIRPEASGLVKLNGEALIRTIPDTPIPVTPRYSLTPAESAHTVGAAATLIAKVVNSSDHDKPLEGYPVAFSIVTGPDAHHPFPWSLRTDANGQVKVSYKGRGVGTDEVLLMKPAPSAATAGSGQATSATDTALPPWAVAEALVHWQGGADLAVPLFAPPLVKTKGGNPINLTDWTQNLGDTPAGPSVTRYYLSKDDPVDPKHAIALAERQVPALKPGEQSRGQPIHTTLPAGLKAGVYNLVACADADHQVTETNETNNCYGSRLRNIVTVEMPVEKSPNRPPVCSKAKPGTPLLWPPNHKLHAVAINGVTDPDHDKVTLTVTGIEQDEPVNGKGDGNTAPDGFGVGTAHVKVRAERSGRGSGRLYFVHFRAADGKGGTCTGSVTVGVPHDRSAKGLPADTGKRYDSTGS